MLGTRVLVLLLVSAATCAANRIGEMRPAGLTKMRVGETLEMTCSLDYVNGTQNSRKLEFRKNGGQVAEELVTRVNDSTLLMRLKNAPLMHAIYICRHENMGVGIAEVLVGTPPKEVTDFKCISLNWEKMNCSFELEYNPISSNYTLNYGRYSDSFVNTMILKPPTNESKYVYTFEVLNYNNVLYNYSFCLHMQNEFGELKQYFVVDNFASIKPDKPMNINANTSISPNGLLLTWNISYVLKPLSYGHIVTQINYTSEFNKNWISVEFEDKPKKMYEYMLKNLTAHTWYDIRIRIRVSKATRDELWSEYESQIFHTIPKIPDKPPRTDIGSFAINDLNDLFLYWHQLKPYEKNGANGTYVITKSTLNGHHYKFPVTMTDIMAKFSTIPDNMLEFEIRSSNSEGRSLDSSPIRIPPKRLRVGYPTELKKNRNGTLYTLSWQKPKHSAEDLESYTVFWCKAKSEQPNQCEESIEFERVNASVTDYTIHSIDGINFAISANSHNSSSGMIWALCTASQSDDIGKLKTMWISKSGSTFIELQWILECVDRPIVTGYNLTYCPITSPKNLTCQFGTELNRTLDGSATQYNITGLKPYTTYKTVITMISKTRIGPLSDPLVNTTLEATPSQPQNLVAYEVHNTSVLLAWNAPEHVNGVLSNYEIWFNERKREFYQDITGKWNLTFRLENLQSYTQYKIVVRACTNCCNCSENSNSIDITTGIGRPASLSLQSSYNGSDNKIVLRWDPPTYPAGKLDYYEVQTVTRRNQNQVVQYKTARTKYTNCFVMITCDPNTIMEFKVRAVNVIWSAHSSNRHLTRRRRNRHEEETMRSLYDDLDGSNQSEGHRSRALKRHSVLGTERPVLQTITDSDHKLSTKGLDHERRYSMHVSPMACHAEEEDIEKLLRTDPYSTELPGEWSQPYIHSCSDYEANFLHHAKWIIVFVVVVFCVVFGVYLVGRFKKMKNIDVELPPGLQDIGDKLSGGLNSSKAALEKNGSGGGGLIITSQSIEGHINTMDDSSELSEKEAEFNRNKDDNMTGSSSETCSLHEQEQSLLRSQVDSNSSATNSIEQFECIMPTMNAPSDVIKGGAPMMIPTTQTTSPIPLNKPGPNGYVTIAQRSNGYTKLDDLKPIPFVTETDEKGITGYVTHKQLADFGQRMQ